VVRKRWCNVANTGIDKRLVKAIVTTVQLEFGYVVKLDVLTTIIKAFGRTEGDGYKLLGEFYDALNEGKLKGAYLIKLGENIERDGILVVSPVELTDEQLKTLDAIVSWVKDVSSVCHTNAGLLLQSIIDKLITLWTGERYYRGVYKFAINNGLTLESDLAELGIKIPPSKNKEGGG
jgi:hypothetical protein